MRPYPNTYGNTDFVALAEQWERGFPDHELTSFDQLKAEEAFRREQARKEWLGYVPSRPHALDDEPGDDKGASTISTACWGCLYVVGGLVLGAVIYVVVG